MTTISESLDRKSTRLNSSHQIISYAVFCLKKKKRAQHASRPTCRAHAHLPPLVSHHPRRARDRGRTRAGGYRVPPRLVARLWSRAGGGGRRGRRGRSGTEEFAAAAG